MTYWFVYQKNHSGGGSRIGLTADGPEYTSRFGAEMRFANNISAEIFRDYAERLLTPLEGQVGKLTVECDSHAH